MTETDKPEGVSVAPPTVPIKGVNVPDPTTGSEPESKEPPDDGETGHEAFEEEGGDRAAGGIARR